MLEAMRRNAQSWGVKIVFGLIIVVFVFWGVGNFKNDKSSVVAYVNEKPILIKDLDKAYQEQIRLARNQNPNLSDKDLADAGMRWQVFGNMVSTMILEDQAARLRLGVSSEELRREIARVPAFQDDKKQFDAKKYESLLTANGISPAEFETDFRKNLLLEKLGTFVSLPAYVTDAEARGIFDYMREEAVIDYLPFKNQDFAQGVTPTEDQIKAYYEANKAKFATPVRIAVEYVDISPSSLARPDEVTQADVEAAYKADQAKFQAPEQVQVRHFLLMLPEDAPEPERKAAEAKLADIAAKLKAGADFASLAPKDPSEGIMAEDYAWLPKGGLPEEFKAFEEAAFTLKKGEVAGPIKTGLGLHVLQAGDRKAAGLTPLADVIEDIRREIAEERAAEKMSKLLDGISDAMSAGADLSKAAADAGVTLKKTDSFGQDAPPVDLGLDEKTARALFKLNKGEATDEALPTMDGFILAKVVEKIEAGTAPLDAVKDKVKEDLVAAEAAAKAKTAAVDAAKALSGDGAAKALESFKDKLVTSQPFSRQGFIPGLGMAPPLAQAAFAAKGDGFFPEPFAVADGYVVARRQKLVPANAEVWSQDKDKWLSSLLSSKQSEIFRAYLLALQQDAKIEMVNEDVLGPKPGAALGAPSQAK